jgi:hypothetical protein
MYESDSIPVPEGYTAYWVTYYHAAWHGSDPIVALGWNEPFSWDQNLHNEPGSLPLYVASAGLDRFAMNLLIACARSKELLRQWQIRTYETIMNGYRRQLAEYEERLANLQSLMRAQMLIGAGAAENRATERVELKRAFLSLLTNQHFDAFDAIDTSSPSGYPQVDIAAAMDSAGFITFFERAFEWDNMLYLLYPYFWGRKAEWASIHQISDPDPQFEAFLKAGAARVIVPVRPGFEAALAHYSETGQVWMGAEEPNIYSPLFAGILTEIGEQDGEETPVGEPWEVRLPTTLVRLRESPKLPEWKRMPDGSWAPVP